MTGPERPQELPIDDDGEEGEEAEGHRFALDPLARHDILHTASVIMNIFHDHRLARPDVEFGDLELKAEAWRGFETFFDFYTFCGSRFLSERRDERRADEPGPVA